MMARVSSAIPQGALIGAIGLAVYAQFRVHGYAGDELGWLLLGIAALFAASFAAPDTAGEAAVAAAAPAPARALTWPGVAARVLFGALAVAAIGAATLLPNRRQQPLMPLVLWLASALLGTLAARGWRIAPPRQALASWTAPQRAVLAAVVGLAALARLLWIDELPSAYFGDEPRVAMYLFQAYHGGRIPEFFSMGWNTWPVVGLSLQGLFAPLLGIHMTTLRLSSALMGTLAVLSTALLARELVGARVALLAAFLLAICRTAIDFSRLGITHAQIMFLEPLAFFFLWRALHGGWAVHYLWAGIATAWCLYSYNAGQLVPVLVFAWVLIAALRRPRAVRAHWGAAALLAAAFALTLLPYLYYFTDAFQFGPNWDQWTIMARNRQTMGRVLDAWRGAGVWPAWAILREQILTTWLGFGVLPGGGYPIGYRRGGMLDDVSAALFVLGLAMALARVRRASIAFLPYWWLATVIAGGIATVDPPSFVRMIGLLPAVAILAALPLEWLLRTARGGAARTVGVVLIAGLAGAAAWQNWRTYFVEFGTQRGDPISELARYIGSLPADRQYAVLGSEHHLAVHNELFMIEFPDRTYDLADPAHAVPLRRAASAPLTLILGPTQTTLSGYIRALYPEAEVTDRVDGQALPFRAVHLSLEAVQRRAGLTLTAERSGAAPTTGVVADPFADPPAAARGADRLVWTGSVYWPTDRPLLVTVDAGQPTTLTIADAPAISADGRTPASATLALAQGWQPLRIEERVQGAHRLAIDVAHPAAPRPLSRWELRPEMTREGLTATYARPDGLALHVVDPQLNAFDVEDRYVAPYGPFVTMPFTATWRGALRIDRPGPYQFEAAGSGPYTVTLDGTELFRARVDVPEQPVIAQARRTLEVGLHPISVEWDSTRAAHTTRRLFQLFWTPPGGEYALIPPSNFVRE